jgi:hypothetical protein
MFRPPDTERLLRSGNMWYGWSLQRLPLRGWCVKLWGWCQRYNGDPRKLQMPRKATGNEWSRRKREATWTSNGEVVGAGLPRPIGAHIMIPRAPDVGHGIQTRFRVCSTGFGFVSLESSKESAMFSRDMFRCHIDKGCICDS